MSHINGRFHGGWGVAALVVVVVAVAGCGNSSDTTTTTPPVDTTTVDTAPLDEPGDQAYPAPSGTEVERWVPEVIDRLAADEDAFTQGLLVDGDVVWESTGLYGESTLRRTDRATGEVLESAALPPDLFGEGLVLVGDELIQLTWREEVALRWDAATLEQVGSFDYQGEGWGLCQLGTELVMSDGSDSLTFRHPETFEVVGTVEVTLDGEPMHRLNELECLEGDDLVLANVWQTNDIVVIDPEHGDVVAVVDASALDEELEEELGRDVLNGIAYDPATDTFLLSGKLWPVTFEVRFVEAP